MKPFTKGEGHAALHIEHSAGRSSAFAQSGERRTSQRAFDAFRVVWCLKGVLKDQANMLAACSLLAQLMYMQATMSRRE